MGSRTIPTECPHGTVIDWGDFGPDPDDGADGISPCEECEREVAGRRVNAPGRGPTRTNLEDNMQTILAGAFGRYVITWHYEDQPDNKHVYHPTDDEDWRVWWADREAVDRELDYLRSVDEGDYVDGYENEDGEPLQRVIYQAHELRSVDDDDATLDALDDMVEQHFTERKDGVLGDDALSANEFAADVLAQRLPDRWVRVPAGLVRRQSS